MAGVKRAISITLNIERKTTSRISTKGFSNLWVRAFGISEWREAWRYGCVGIANEDDFQGRIVNFDSHDNVALLSGIIVWIPGEKHYTVLRARIVPLWGLLRYTKVAQIGRCAIQFTAIPHLSGQSK